MTFGPKISTLNSRPVYCSRIYGILGEKSSFVDFFLNKRTVQSNIMWAEKFIKTGVYTNRKLRA